MVEMKSKEYPWVAFYIEFANKLLAFANDRKPLITMIKDVYKEIGINLPKLEKDGEVFDIDPYHVNVQLFRTYFTFRNVAISFM